jgi:hypothetical protein
MKHEFIFGVEYTDHKVRNGITTSPIPVPELHHRHGGGKRGQQRLVRNRCQWCRHQRVSTS